MDHVFSVNSNSSPVTELVKRGTARLGAHPSDAALAACLFDVRRALVEKLLQQPAPSAQDTPEAPPLKPILDDAQEDILRDSLPPLHVPAGPYNSLFSAWRAAIVAILGLVLGSAVAQGLGLSGAAAVVLSTVGVGAALWGADRLAESRAQGELRLGTWHIRWKTLRRMARLLWGAALVLTLLRDFLQQNPALQNILSAMADFLLQGMALALIQNMYWLLALSLVFALLCRKPLRLDTAEYHMRLHIAAQVWWDGALLVRESLLARHEALHGKQHQLRQKAAQELYSFAAELPSAQAFWLREHLHMLGFSTAASPAARPAGPDAPDFDTGQVLWRADLTNTYDVVGYVEEGDRCFVDTPPLMDDEQLVRKGILRKVRT